MDENTTVTGPWKGNFAFFAIARILAQLLLISELCSMKYHTLERARKWPGTDEDLIVVQLHAPL